MLHPTTRLQERYQIVRLLGQGGMGAVYEAFDERLLMNVALKQTLQHSATLDRAFEREAQMLARLRHPMLPLVSDYFAEADGQFLVMQYIPGDDLATLLARQSAPFPLIDVLRWADQLLDILTYLHTHQPPIIHRDIKPQNLKRTPDGSIVLLDFGLAKGPTGSDSTNAIHSLFGYTPQYAPLEQIHGTGTDSRSDLFALAATCYHLLTGMAPIDAVRRAANVVAGQSDPLFITNTLWAGIPPAIAAVLTQGLALDPAQRPASAAELRVLLHQASVAEITAVVVPDAAQIEKAAELQRQPQETRLRPNNLPVALTPIVGRADEIRRAIEMLKQDSIRLLTLTGPGGTGKTRLSLEIAIKASTVDEPSYWADGVFFVSLAPVRDPALVLSAIAQVLEVRESGGQSLRDALHDFVREKRLLLVLDNFEQIVAAGPQLVDLLEGAPHLKLLVTSREMLRLRGEHELPVSPLVQSAAVELFVQRAQAVRFEFKLDAQNEHLITDICARLDRLPLAIELAAARIRALTPQALLERLGNRLKLLTGGARDLPTRQQTLHSTIAWSYELLDAGEQLLFRRLSVFIGGRTLEAAEAVCNAAIDLPIDVLDGIQSLLDKSLLYQQEGVNGEPRFMMLETIWEYAQEQLKASGEEDALRRAHAEYYLWLAEQAEPELRGANQALWLARLADESDNERIVFSWLVQRKAVEKGLRLCITLSRFWSIYGKLTEGREWMHLFLTNSTEISPELHAQSLCEAGNLATIQGDYEQAQLSLKDSLTLYRQLNDQRGIAQVLNNLGNLSKQCGDYAAARTFHMESLSIRKITGDQWGIGASLGNLGNIARQQGDFSVARESYEECIKNISSTQ